MSDLFTREVASFRAPVLIHHLSGGMDAGDAGRLVSEQLRAALPATRIGTFNTDALLDYRSHRPTVWVENWQVGGVKEPELALDLVHDYEGTPILLLHGPEPDFKWNAFRDEVARIVKEAGVELTVSAFGVPVPVPHTRPTPVHATGTAAAHLQRPSLIGAMQTAASLDMLLDVDHAQRGGDTLQLVAFVPFYLGEASSAGAAAAVIGHLSEVTGLKLPVGDLEAAASSQTAPVESLLELAGGEDGQFSEFVSMLEKQYDNALPALADNAAKTESGDLPTGEEIAQAMQGYLASLGQQKAAPPASVAGAAAKPAAASRRPRHRREDPISVQFFGGGGVIEGGDDAAVGRAEHAPGQPGGVPGQPGGVPGQEGSAPGEPGGVPGQPGEVPNEGANAPGEGARAADPAEKPATPMGEPGGDGRAEEPGGALPEES